jgi:glycosyltransferase involved in cell wall biosynthesis
MRILLVGGIFGKSPEYRRVVTTTPETVLSAGLRARGHDVVEQPHAPPYAIKGFDLVHVHHLADGALEVASASPSLPFAFTSHWLRHERVTRRLAARYIFARAGAVVALSETEAAWQRDECRGVAARQHVIPNGIDETTFRFSAPQAPRRGAPWRLLFVGQLAAFKGVDILLRALALLTDTVSTRLELAYQVDAEEANLRSQAERLGLTDVHFLGARSPVELAEDYARAHVFVLPSYGEALPSVISEAMFVGRPVIATDVGGVREQVRDFGQIVAPGDPWALAAALRTIIDDYGGYIAQAPVAAQRAVDRYSVNTMVSAHETMYRALIRRTPTRRPLDAAFDATLRAVRRLPRSPATRRVLL